VRSVLGPTLALLALTVACGGRPVEPEQSPNHRLELLSQAFAVREHDPTAAADLFARAGSGPTLERARQEAWRRALEASGADSIAWQAFLDARPADDLAASAILAQAAALSAEGDRAAAVTTLMRAPESARDRADLELLVLGDETAAAAAAHRLARVAPRALRNRSRAIEKAALASFDHDDWMTRARSWRAVGLGSRGAAEIRGRRGTGEQEVQRRRELARCELEAGSSTRALNALPSRNKSAPEDLVLRAEAYRRQGWGRSPDRSAERSFRTCLEEADSAGESTDHEIRTTALTLVLECGTESGQLDRALAAWHDLEASGWNDRRRSWLGRRLGVALARSDAEFGSPTGLATSLSQHERCFLFWRSLSPKDTDALAELSAARVSDLYGSWARSLLTTGHDPSNYTPPEPIPAAAATPAVAWLLEHAGPGQASAEWQRLFKHRLPTRSETMAAVSLAQAAGHANTAIRSLRRGFPGISSIAIAQIPSNAAFAYLPLRFEEHLVAAAHKNGLDPWLIAALARQESTFVATARSPAGARGVLQLLPSTARMHSRALGLGSRPDLNDPAVNITLGARELAALIRRYGAVEPALAAYNAGDRRVRKWWRTWPNPHLFTESIPIPETYNYVRRVTFLADAYRQIHADAWTEAP